MAPVHGSEAPLAGYPTDLTTHNTVSFIGADKIHSDLKITGKGVVVGVIDTGIDYTHAMFGGAGTPAAYQAVIPGQANPAFPTDKVIGGIDLVGTDYDDNSGDFSKHIPHSDPTPSTRPATARTSGTSPVRATASTLTPVSRRTRSSLPSRSSARTAASATRSSSRLSRRRPTPRATSIRPTTWTSSTCRSAAASAPPTTSTWKRPPTSPKATSSWSAPPVTRVCRATSSARRRRPPTPSRSPPASTTWTRTSSSAR